MSASVAAGSRFEPTTRTITHPAARNFHGIRPPNPRLERCRGLAPAKRSAALLLTLMSRLIVCSTVRRWRDRSGRSRSGSCARSPVQRWSTGAVKRLKREARLSGPLALVLAGSGRGQESLTVSNPPSIALRSAHLTGWAGSLTRTAAWGMLCGVVLMPRAPRHANVDQWQPDCRPWFGGGR